MSLHHWIGIGLGGLLVAFIVFAFRQGTKVKPDRTRGASTSSNEQYIGDGGPGLGDGGGHA